MTHNIKYRNISLRNETFSKLDYLSENLVPGQTLSKSSTVDNLVNEKFDNSNGSKDKGVIDEKLQNQEA
jgi:hypothetical protein